MSEPSRGKRKPRKGDAFIPWMSREDVARRVAMRERDPEPAPTAPVAPSAPRVRRVDPRRVLWRDSATILVVVVLALLGVQAFLPRVSGGPLETEIPSGIVIGSLPPGSTPLPPATFPPIVDPSLGLDATPTPIPVITLGPAASPTPKPKPSPKPTPKPTRKPSAPPLLPPTAPPTSAPT